MKLGPKELHRTGRQGHAVTVVGRFRYVAEPEYRFFCQSAGLLWPRLGLVQVLLRNAGMSFYGLPVSDHYGSWNKAVFQLWVLVDFLDANWARSRPLCASKPKFQPLGRLSQWQTRQSGGPCPQFAHAVRAVAVAVSRAGVNPPTRAELNCIETAAEDASVIELTGAELDSK